MLTSLVWDELLVAGTSSNGNRGIHLSEGFYNAFSGDDTNQYQQLKQVIAAMSRWIYNLLRGRQLPFHDITFPQLTSRFYCEYCNHLLASATHPCTPASPSMSAIPLTRLSASSFPEEFGQELPADPCPSRQELQGLAYGFRTSMVCIQINVSRRY